MRCTLTLKEIRCIRQSISSQKKRISQKSWTMSALEKAGLVKLKCGCIYDYQEKITKDGKLTTFMRKHHKGTLIEQIHEMSLVFLKLEEEK